MGYIARNLITNEVFYSKGANKISDKVGCHYSTITLFFSKNINKHKDKELNGWIISKVVEILNKSRGKSF